MNVCIQNFNIQLPLNYLDTGLDKMFTGRIECPEVVLEPQLFELKHREKEKLDYILLLSNQDMGINLQIAISCDPLEGHFNNGRLDKIISTYTDYYFKQ